jgi:hypothetical protein
MRLVTRGRPSATAPTVALFLFLLGATSVPEPARAAQEPVFVRASVGPRASAGKLPIATPAGTAAGDVLIAGVAEHEIGRITAPAGWTLLREDKVQGDVWLWMWYRVAGGSEPAEHVWEVPDKAANGAILDYRGVDTASPVVASAGQGNAGNSTDLIQVPSMDVGSTRPTRLVMFATVEGPTPNHITPPEGFTERTERAVHPSTESSDLPFPGTGPTGVRTAKATKAASSAGAIVALRPAP